MSKPLSSGTREVFAGSPAISPASPCGPAMNRDPAGPIHWYGVVCYGTSPGSGLRSRVLSSSAYAATSSRQASPDCSIASITLAR